jgi:1-deoxy-D-xylulose-5-phosphate reductoisomerase
MKKVAILGSTGSIGGQTLGIIEDNIDRFRVVALTANRNIPLIKEQAEKFRPEIVAMGDEESAEELRKTIPNNVKVVSGEEGMVTAASESGADILVTSVVGSAGLLPTMRAVEKGIDIALANKETLVAGGKIVTEAANKNGVKLLPVDSEHNALYQSLKGHEGTGVKRLILTASGGPFWKKGLDELEEVTPAEAVKHPRWNMGAKISVDSATMMNKALEIIEARWLFDVDGERIDVLIHPQSIVHSMVEYIDGSVIAQMGTTDMRIPIAYALSYPERIENRVPELNLADLSKNGVGLTFFSPDHDRFPALRLAYRSLETGGTMPAVMSAANEAAVSLFLEGKIDFLDIVRTVSEVMERHDVVDSPDLNETLEADLWARREAEKIRGTL